METASLKSLRLLLVDDDPATQRSIVRVLELHGAHVTAADTVEDATQIIDRAKPFDAAIIDYQLVDQNGLGLVSKLRSGMKPCCALMITGEPDEDRGKQAIAAGADDFLVKPFVASELIKAVKRSAWQTKQWRTRLAVDPQTVQEARENGHAVVRDEDSVEQVQIPEFQVIYKELSRAGDLDERERPVLEQVLLGKTNKEAGIALGLKERTVKYRMAGILKKIGVSSRNELLTLIWNKRSKPSEPAE